MKGQDFLEVEVVEFACRPFRLIAVEDADLAAGTQDAEELGQAVLVAGQVAEAECGGNQVR